MNIRLRDLLHPKYWLSWLFIFIAFIVLNCLTYNGRTRLGAWLAPLVKLFMPYRLLVSSININHCFASSPDKANRIYEKHVISIGKGIVDALSCYLLPYSRICKKVVYLGEEHLQDAINKQKGVLLLSAHCTGLEIGSLLISSKSKGFGVYRPMSNQVFDYIIYRARQKYAKGMIPQNDIRSLIKILKSGETLWYASDQDFGRKGKSSFAPFYGVSAYTLTFYAQLAKKTGAVVVPGIGYRDDNKKCYIVKFLKAIDPKEYASEQQAAATMNKAIEELMYGYEDQYYWTHRRFKTRPDGEKSFYPEKPSRLKRQAKRRKLKDKTIN